MSGRFAGAGSVDGRRRRRLAGGEDVEPAEHAAAAGDRDRPVTPRPPTDRFPLRRVLSRRGWKVWAAAVVLAAVCGAAAWATVDPTVRGGAFGRGVADLFDPAGGTAVPGLVGLMLLAAGRWAFVVRWARGRSRGDFTGRYGVWSTASLAATASGAAVLLGLPAALGPSLAAAGGSLAVRLPEGIAVPWAAVPFAAVGLFLLPGLHRETRGSWAARCGLWLAAVCWSAGFALAAAPGWLPASVPPVAAAVLPAATLLGGTLGCLGLCVFHARRVLYVSVEPPAVRVKATRATANESADPVASDERPDGTPAVAGRIEPAAEVDDEPAPERKPSRRPKPTDDARRAALARVEAGAAEAESSAAEIASGAVAEDGEAGDEPDTVRFEDVPTTVEVAGAVLDLTDPEGDLLKGLSKRERRTVRKALRERERMLARAA